MSFRRNIRRELTLRFVSVEKKLNDTTDVYLFIYFFFVENCNGARVSIVITNEKKSFSSLIIIIIILSSTGILSVRDYIGPSSWPFYVIRPGNEREKLSGFRPSFSVRRRYRRYHIRRIFRPWKSVQKYMVSNTFIVFHFFG